MAGKTREPVAIDTLITEEIRERANNAAHNFRPPDRSMPWLARQSGVTRQAAGRWFYNPDTTRSAVPNLIPKEAVGMKISELPPNIEARVIYGLAGIGEIGNSPVLGSEPKIYNDGSKNNLKDAVTRILEYTKNDVDKALARRWTSLSVSVNDEGYIDIDVEYLYGYSE
jgi:hypothetical protein